MKEAVSKEDFLNKIWTWHIQSKHSAASMDQEEICLRYLSVRTIRTKKEDVQFHSEALASSNRWARHEIFLPTPTSSESKSSGEKVGKWRGVPETFQNQGDGVGPKQADIHKIEPWSIQ